eukprot:2182948-Rhodomonas_salina.3
MQCAGTEIGCALCSVLLLSGGSPSRAQREQLEAGCYLALLCTTPTCAMLYRPVLCDARYGGGLRQYYAMRGTEIGYLLWAVVVPGAHVVVATPGRCLQLLEQGAPPCPRSSRSSIALPP